MNCRSLLCAALLTLCSFAAHAETSQALVAQSLAEFKTEAAAIREQMHPGRPYGNIAPRDRQRVEAGLANIEKLLSAHAGESDLRHDDKIALLNAQEEVNGILHHNDNNRLVCEKTIPVGSHLPVTVCRSYGEIVEQRRADQKFLQDRSIYNH